MLLELDFHIFFKILQVAKVRLKKPNFSHLLNFYTYRAEMNVIGHLGHYFLTLATNGVLKKQFAVYLGSEQTALLKQ